jgi:hypothetical protein
MTSGTSAFLPGFAVSPSRRERRGQLAIRLLLAAFLPVFAAACDEALEPEAPAPAPDAVHGSALPRITWLDMRDTTTPERWLASRAAHTDLGEKDEAVIAMRKSLKEAASRFGDPPRMIANRAVQLEQMLAGTGIEESAPDLIASFTAVSDAQSREGFGAMCQQYFYLRKQGMDREAALKQLKLSFLPGAGDAVDRG